MDLVIKGFNNKDEVLQFCSWYEGQGEQDISYFLECRKDEGLIDIDSITCKGYEEVDGEFILMKVNCE